VSAAMNPHTDVPHPDRVAEVLMRFAQPVLDTAPPGVSPETLERALVTAASVWNADVLDQLSSGGEYLAEIRDRVAAENPAFIPMVDMLSIRRRRMFIDATFLMGNVTVTTDDEGGFLIAANGRNVESETTED